VPIETTCEATGAAAPMIRVSGQNVFISPLLMIKAAGVAKSPKGLGQGRQACPQRSGCFSPETSKILYILLP